MTSSLLAAASFYGGHLLLFGLLAATAWVLGRLLLGDCATENHPPPFLPPSPPATPPRGEEPFGEGPLGQEGRPALPSSLGGRVALPLALGLAGLAQLAFLLGLGHLLLRPVLLLVVAGIHLAGWRIWRESATAVRVGLREIPRGRRLGIGVSGVSGVAVLLLGLPLFLLALYPPTAFDATLYHLPDARAFARSGGLPFLPQLRFPVFPQLAEALFAAVLLLAGASRDMAVHLVQLLMIVATAGLLVAWGEEALSRRAGLLAAAAYLGGPIVVHLGTSAYVEADLTLFTTAALYSLWRYREAERRSGRAEGIGDSEAGCHPPPVLPPSPPITPPRGEEPSAGGTFESGKTAGRASLPPGRGAEGDGGRTGGGWNRDQPSLPSRFPDADVRLPAGGRVPPPWAGGGWVRGEARRGAPRGRTTFNSVSNSHRFLILAAVFGASAADVKYLGLFFLAAVGLGVVAITLSRPRRPSRLLIFSAVVVAMLLPGYGRILYYTHNPVFPLLPGLFGHSAWDPVLPPFSPGHALRALATLPWDVVFSRARTGGQPPFSPFLLLAVPLLLVVTLRDRRARPWMLLAGAYAVLFPLFPPDSRYLLPIVPLLCLALAAGLDRPALARGSTTIAGLALLLLLPGVLYAVYRIVRQGAPPVTAAARESYLTAHLPLYPALAWLNRERGRDFTVYAFFAENMTYFAEGTLLGDWQGRGRFTEVLPAFSDPDALWQRLRGLGAGYLLIPCDRGGLPVPEGPAWRRRFRTVYADAAAEIFELFPRQGRFSVSLRRHVGRSGSQPSPAGVGERNLGGDIVGFGLR